MEALPNFCLMKFARIFNLLSLVPIFSCSLVISSLENKKGGGLDFGLPSVAVIGLPPVARLAVPPRVVTPFSSKISFSSDVTCLSLLLALRVPTMPEMLSLLVPLVQWCSRPGPHGEKQVRQTVIGSGWSGRSVVRGLPTGVDMSFLYWM